MKMVIFLLLLYSCDASAYTLMLKWYPPTEREDNAPLPIDEISHFSMYEVDCANPVIDREAPKYAKIYHKQGILYWTSEKRVDCIVMFATDTDGKESFPSAVFKAVEYNAPRPVECRQ